MLKMKPLRDEDCDRGHLVEQVTSQEKSQSTSLKVKLAVLFASILALTIIACRSYIGSDLVNNQALLKEAKSASLLDERNIFVLKDLFSSKNFASFLPEIGGTFGIPLWCFSVNRGQGITAFGITTKEYPLMEFKPANQPWQQVSRTGFRIYIRGTSGTQSFEYQPFFIGDEQELKTIHRRMYTGINEFEIEEVNDELNFRTNIPCFNIPSNEFARLVRRMSLTNAGHKDLEMDLLDGLQLLLPNGVNDSAFSTISRTLEAWMNVFGIDEDPTTPSYHLITSFIDSEISKSSDDSCSTGFSPTLFLFIGLVYGALFFSKPQRIWFKAKIYLGTVMFMFKLMCLRAVLSVLIELKLCPVVKDGIRPPPTMCIQEGFRCCFSYRNEPRHRPGCSSAVGARKNHHNTSTYAKLVGGMHFVSSEQETNNINAFFDAATAGEISVLKEILKQNPSFVNARDPRESVWNKDYTICYPREGATACIYAAMKGEAACLELLLQNGAKLDEADAGGYTALIWSKRPSGTQNFNDQGQVNLPELWILQ